MRVADVEVPRSMKLRMSYDERRDRLDRVTTQPATSRGYERSRLRWRDTLSTTRKSRCRESLIEFKETESLRETDSAGGHQDEEGEASMAVAGDDRRGFAGGFHRRVGYCEASRWDTDR